MQLSNLILVILTIVVAVAIGFSLFILLNRTKQVRHHKRVIQRLEHKYSKLCDARKMRAEQIKLAEDFSTKMSTARSKINNDIVSVILEILRSGHGNSSVGK